MPQGQDWFHKHESEFILVQWPAQSPDLNPIKHLWDENEPFWIRDPLPGNWAQRWEALGKSWGQHSCGTLDIS
jgi:hypothetical protein